MKAIIPLLMTGIMAINAASVAQAGPVPHERLRHYDDLVFSVMVDARSLRWTIHDDLSWMPDQNRLLREADQLTEHLQRLQRYIYDERGQAALDQELDAALRTLATLRSGLPPTASHHMRRPGRLDVPASGYDYTPQSHHAGRPVGNSAIALVSQMTDTLNHLHQEVMGSPAVAPQGPVGPALPHAPTRNRGPNLPNRPANNWQLPDFSTGLGSWSFRFGN